MKILTRLFANLIIVAILIAVLAPFVTQPANAAPGESVCMCVAPVASEPSKGVWISTSNGTMSDGGTSCKDAGGYAGACNPFTDAVVVSPVTVPKLGSFMGNIIRIFFLIAGIVALMYMLMGAMKWITSSGKEEGVKEARDQIQAAVLGLIVMVAVLSIAVIIEQVVFGGKICLGISCPLQIGSLNLTRP